MERGFKLIEGDEINCILSVALRTMDTDELIILRDKLIKRTPSDDKLKEASLKEFPVVIEEGVDGALKKILTKHQEIRL